MDDNQVADKQAEKEEANKESPRAGQEKTTAKTETGEETCEEGSLPRENRKGAEGESQAPAGSAEKPLRLTELAAEKVKEITAAEGIGNARLRVAVKGGGCSGFSYAMLFDEEKMEIDGEEKLVPVSPDDPVRDIDRLIKDKSVAIVVDELSLMYLYGTTIDYVESLQGAGFKFDNPTSSSHCGCGSSFSV